MDQPSNPQTAANGPSGAPILPDAAREPHEPAIIRRKDYKPFAWRVPEIRLDFDLGLETTRVEATLKVAPNPDAEAAHEIRLDGDGLVLESVAVDGEQRTDWRREGEALIVPLSPGEHVLTIATRIAPLANTQLMGLYASNGMLCTQCEAEGFRRITFFPDRPDVLSVYTVRMEADAGAFPVLLSNGNPVEQGTLEDGRHFARGPSRATSSRWSRATWWREPTVSPLVEAARSSWASGSAPKTCRGPNTRWNRSSGR